MVTTDDRMSSASESSVTQPRSMEKDDVVAPSSLTAAPTEDLEKQKPKQPDKDPNLVIWDGLNDPENPFGWTTNRKLFVSSIMIFIPFVVNIGTSIFAPANGKVKREFGVSSEVAILGTSLFMLGFACGPLIFGPASEKIGRRWPVLIGATCFSIFTLAVGLAQNFYTIYICRFFSGVFGSSSMAVLGGALSDIWASPEARGISLDFLIATGFLGPLLGPIFGSLIVNNPNLGWRWTMYISAIIGFCFSIWAFFFLPETYAPVLLTQKAKRLRFETQNWALHSKLEEERTTFSAFAKTYLIRPYYLLATEPILLFITLYLAFIYGLLFLFLEAFPISFALHRHWTQTEATLPFLGLLAGMVVGMIAIVTHTLTVFSRQLKANPGFPIPERRLPLMMVGGALLPIGLFWFAWTSSSSINPAAQLVATIPIAAGMYMLFMQGVVYTVDVYLLYANSAISCQTVVRSFFGAGFPLFASPMFENLGVPWATSTLGFIAVALVPVPVIFYIYGKKIRGWSRSAMNKR